MSIELLNWMDLNIRERSKLLIEANKSDEIKKSLISICKRDLIYFFTYFVYTDRNPSLIPEKFGNAVPFIPYEYQEEFLNDAWDAILMGQLPIEERISPTDVFSEKSRQLGFSWLFAGLQLYAYLFHNIKSLYISKKAEEVDKNWDIKSHFEKIRFMIRNLPNWILPKWLDKNSWTDHNKFMNISRADWTGNIVWESANPNAWRWGTFGFVIFDEMAFMQYAQAINMSISSATPCRFFNSTPNWEWNEYYRMRKLALTTNEFWQKQEQKIRYHRCHRSEHPLYTQEWYDWKTKWMTKEQIAQELEIDYNVAIKGRVYAWFKGYTEKVDYNPTKPLFIIIDNSHWWTDPHAIVIAQSNFDNHYWDIVDSIEMNCWIPEMANFLAWAPKMALNDSELAFLERYKNYNWRDATFISDPYDTHSNIKNIHSPDGIVIFNEYQKVWIHLNTPNTKDNPKTTQIIKTNSNIHRLRVNERCMDFISAIQNAKYPDIKEWAVIRKPSNEPIHDWTSHYRTALEYFTIYMLDNFVETQKKAEPERIVEEIKNPVTWEIQYLYNYT